MPQGVLIGNRIRERRLILGLKQAELARRVGISASYLNLIEHNRRGIGGKLVVDLAHALDVDSKVLTEGAEAILIETLREASALFPETQVEELRIEEFADRFPGWAKLIGAQLDRQKTMERTIEVLSDRLTHDPFLSASLHEVISTVTAIRSTSSILSESDDLDPEWLARFHRNINEESHRLTESSQSLIAYLDGVGDAQTGATSPQEELDSFLVAWDFHIPALEASGPEGVAELVAEVGDGLSQAGRDLIEKHLLQYAQDAQALPLHAVLEAYQQTPDDPLTVATRLAAPLPLVFRRLAALPTDKVENPFGLVTCDGAGALTFRREIAGFSVPRFGSACALWPLFQALSRPMTPLRSILEQSNRQRDTFTALSYADVTYPNGFDGPPVVQSSMLVLPKSDTVQASEHTLPIGVSCRICTREGCAARREPSILRQEF